VTPAPALTWAALLTPYSPEETAERYQAVRDAEARRRAAGAAAQGAR
jgi:hypothetical protein